jgi:hypothetical protein
MMQTAEVLLKQLLFPVRIGLREWFFTYSATVQYDVEYWIVQYSTPVITDTYRSEIEIPVYYRPLINIGKLPEYLPEHRRYTEIPTGAHMVWIYQYTYLGVPIPDSTAGGNIFPIPAWSTNCYCW